MKRSYIYYALLFCLSFAHCAAGQEPEPVTPPVEPEPPVYEIPVRDTLIILSTNDVHAQIGNMAKEAAYIKATRERYKNVLVVSAGDIFSGSATVDQYDDRGYPIVDLMNRMGYQVMALGNHDFDYGQEVLGRRIGQAEFPMLCANADFSATVLDKQIMPFDTLRVGSVKVAVLAVVQTSRSSLIPSTHPNNVAGIKFSDATRPAFWSEWSWLRNWGDVFVVVSHLGEESDTELFPTLATKPDVVIGGHSHSTINPAIMSGNVMITQTGSNLTNIGRTMITFEDGRITSRTNTLVALSSLTAEDADLKREVQTYLNNPKFLEVIGRASASFSGRERIGNLMTDALTDRLECDIAFTNSGGVRISSMPAGDITLGKVYEMDPFENLTMTYNMSLAEIKALLVYTCKYVTADDRYNFNLYISGAKYAYNIANRSVELTDYDGNPLPDKIYKVAMSTYVDETYMSRITHNTDPGGTLINKTTASCLVDYIKARGAVSPTNYRASSVL